MSASSKKKLRKEQNAEIMTERQKKERSEAKKLKAMTITFMVVLITIVCIFVGTISVDLVVKNGVIEKLTTAVTIGDHKLNSVTMNYFFRDAVMNERDQYGEYASYILQYDPAKPLNEQPKEGTDGTWADYYMNIAIENARAVYTMYDKAAATGYKLSEDYTSQIDQELQNMMLTAMFSYGMELDTYLRETYGNGSSEKNYREYKVIQVTASAYYNEHKNEVYGAYTAEQIANFEKNNPSKYDSYTFNSYSLNYQSFLKGGTVGSDGKRTYSDAEKDAARQAAKEAAAELAAAKNLAEFDTIVGKIADRINKLKQENEAKPTEPTATEPQVTEPQVTEPNATEPSATEPTTSEPTASEPTAAAPTTKPSTSTTKSQKSTDVAYTSLNKDYAEWFSAADRKEGDIKTFPVKANEVREDKSTKEVENSYTVVMYISTNHNKTPNANVRHLLVAFEGGKKDAQGNTTYTTEEKKKAKDEADKLLNEFKAGDKSEASFIELVKKHTDDTASKETGGLYEDVNKSSSFVDSFKNWAVANVGKVGNTGIVESTYGYHIMFYSSDSKTTYRDYLIKEDMIVTDMEAWEKSVVEAVTPVKGNFSKINLDLIVTPAADNHEGHDHA